MTFPVFIKASRSKINVAKEVREVNRLRLNHEKRMSSALYSAFRGAGVSAAQEYESSGSVARSVASLQERLATIMASQYREVVQTFAARVYDGRKFTSFTDLVSQLYAREGAAKVSNITETTRRQILKAITTGEDEGLGVTKIAKLIRESTSGAIGRARAATIARTETHAAASWATDQANRELGLPGQKKRWVTVQDARSRSHHAAANGQEVGIDEPFIIRYKGQEIRMMHPHDGSGGAANNVNCRCLAVYFSDDDALFAELDAAPVDAAPEQDLYDLLSDKIEFDPDVADVAPLSKTEIVDLLRSGLTSLSARVVSKIEPPRKITKTYHGSYGTATLDIRTTSDRDVFVHEYGHHIDNHLAGMEGPTAFKYWSETGLKDAWQKDMERLGFGDPDKVDGLLEKYKSDFFEERLIRKLRSDGTYRIRRRTVEKFEGVTLLSDVIDSFSKGRFMDEFGADGHGAAYWRRGPDMATAEAFANMFAAMNHKQASEWFKKNTPNMWKAFIDKMEEVANG